MSTSTIDGRTTGQRTSTWTCPNCHACTHEPRKRCTDCGTSRY